MTRQMLEELTGKEPDNSLAVSEVVARGAALHAGIVAAQDFGEDLLMEEAARDVLAQVVEINVNAHSLGIEVKQGQERINDILIPKNTQLPTAASRVYCTVVENQQRVRVKVLQGEAHAGRRLHQHRRVLDRGTAAEPAEVVAGAGALRRRQQRPHRRDGPGHDQRQNGPHRNSSLQRPVR